MEPKHQSLTLSFILLTVLLDLASSDINQDKAECANQLVGLAPCIPYVGGEAKTPTVGCCGGVKQVLDKSKKCLCVLLKDKDDPSLGLKINTTLAATLPSICHAPTNITDCISLLHLAPNSQDAKLFEEYQKLTEAHGTTPAATASSSSGASSAAQKSDGGRGKTRVGFKMALRVSLWIFIAIQQSLCV
ncbi:hypothetical protein V6N12_064380 [Hibiscus sabdariffa]|uniref:Bifunctional inhibitor/plant lipid transfer protein/seed storage helical domain-containing protein n=1 Tax=Hibiscus sabdariffa TaxID=183260 RepID=A0ABR2G5K9_9ROSI